MEQNLQTDDKNRKEYPLTDIVKLDATLNEILQKVPSTAEILVYKQQNFNINTQWKDWALEMLMAGYETENLFILAGEDIHCNPFEFTELTDKIERLSADDYKMVIMLVNRLSEKNETMTLKRLNEDELVEELAESIRKSDMGATKSARSVSESMRKKYAV